MVNPLPSQSPFWQSRNTMSLFHLRDHPPVDFFFFCLILPHQSIYNTKTNGDLGLFRISHMRWPLFDHPTKQQIQPNSVSILSYGISLL